MTVTEVDEATFRDEVLASELPVVVDFYADWCGPCHQLSPIVHALAEKWDGTVRFAKVDIEQSPAIASAYRISSIPAVLLFEAGEPTAWSIGVKPGYLLERELKLTKLGGDERKKRGLLGRWKKG